MKKIIGLTVLIFLLGCATIDLELKFDFIQCKNKCLHEGNELEVCLEKCSYVYEQFKRLK